jgi:glycosyltransferase involved in cell wall biosynthesis
MDVSIITPSFNSGRYLPLAAASVADQAGVTAEHLVVDGGSTDGTVGWLQSSRGLRWSSGPDRGMYDAVNKGLAVAGGAILGYLNCDEQYLPGTLAAVADAFRANPGIDLIYGDMLVVNPDGGLLAFRKSYPLRWPYVAAAHLYVPSCALFWRRRVRDAGLVFDTRWCIQGDADFVLRVLRAGHRAARLPRYLAAFTLADANLGNTPAARKEMLAARAGAPWWIRGFRPAWNGARHAEKLLSGAHRQAFPLDYDLYTRSDLTHRVHFTAPTGTFRWPVAG